MDVYDFSGIATAYDILCGDKRVIEDGAFNHQEGQTVPVVWRHDHKNISNFLGHTDLSVNPAPPGVSGMRATTLFNNTTEGRRAKVLVQSGDVEGLSIYANELEEVQDGAIRRVKKGTIREVSLVLKGLNPGARIDDVVRHSEDPLDPDMIVLDGIIVHNANTYPLEFPDKKEKDVGDPDKKDKKTDADGEPKGTITHEDKTLRDVLDTLSKPQIKVFDVILHAAITGEEIPPGKSSSNGDGATVQAIYDGLSEKQKTVLHFMVGELSQEATISQEDKGDANMGKNSVNIFEKKKGVPAGNVLSHEAANGVIQAACDQRVSSLRTAFQEHSLEHSITDIDFMFPDARKVDSGGPAFFTRPIEWVEGVLSATRPRPFSRIKSMYADLTPDAARAKGYVTAALKVEEVIAVLKRVTTPQTIYKLQKLDRDDILDITEFSVVAWLKAEMRLMLREELARAILISDGRDDTGADAILSANVRPIYSDSAVYTVDAIFNDVGNEQVLSLFTATEIIELVDFIADAMKDYRGSGSPIFYCQPEVLTALLLVRDTTNRRLYSSEADLAASLRVSKVVAVPPMSGLTRTGEVDPPGLPTGTYNIDTLGVIVNLADYVVGMDRGGETNFFDDFDIDYNKYTYLYETRLSGALVSPSSDISVELVIAKTA